MCVKLSPATILIIANSESIFKLITIENIYIHIYIYNTKDGWGPKASYTN